MWGDPRKASGGGREGVGGSASVSNRPAERPPTGGPSRWAGGGAGPPHPVDARPAAPRPHRPALPAAKGGPCPSIASRGARRIRNRPPNPCDTSFRNSRDFRTFIFALDLAHASTNDNRRQSTHLTNPYTSPPFFLCVPTPLSCDRACPTTPPSQMRSFRIPRWFLKHGEIV